MEYVIAAFFLPGMIGGLALAHSVGSVLGKCSDTTALAIFALFSAFVLWCLIRFSRLTAQSPERIALPATRQSGALMLLAAIVLLFLPATAICWISPAFTGTGFAKTVVESATLAAPGALTAFTFFGAPVFYVFLFIMYAQWRKFRDKLRRRQREQPESKH